MSGVSRTAFARHVSCPVSNHARRPTPPPGSTRDQKEDRVPPVRAVIASTDARLRRLAAAGFLEAGCAVTTATGGTACLGKVGACRPDLLVLLPPLRWGSLVGILAALRDQPATRQVPVLVLPT